MGNELLITAIFTIITLAISVYTSRSSAKKNVVDGLAALVDRLEERLSKEEAARAILERKLAVRDIYIKMLVRQLRDNNLVPPDMPSEDE